LSASFTALIPANRPGAFREHGGENRLGPGEPVIRQDEVLRLADWVCDQPLGMQSVGDCPVEPHPDAVAVMQRQAEDRQSRIVELLSVEFEFRHASNPPPASMTLGPGFLNGAKPLRNREGMAGFDFCSLR